MLLPFASIVAFASDPADVTYYSRSAAKAPIVVFINRLGQGRVCRYDGRLRVVSTFSIEPATARPSNRDAGYTYTALPSPDGTRVLIIDPDFGRFRVAQLRPFKTLWRSGDTRAQISESIWSADGERLVVPDASSNDASGVYRVRDGKPLGIIPIAYPFALVRGRLYGMAGYSAWPRGVSSVDLSSLKLIRFFSDRSVESPLGVSPDGLYLVTGGRDKTGEHFQYRIWRTADGRRTAVFLGQGRSANHILDPLFIGRDRFALLKMQQLRRIPDGKILKRLPEPASPSFGGGVYVLDPKHPLVPRYLIPSTAQPETEK